MNDEAIRNSSDRNSGIVRCGSYRIYVSDQQGVQVDPWIEGVVSGARSIPDGELDREEISSVGTPCNSGQFRRDIREIVE